MLRPTPTVVHLLFLCGPSAILRFIVPVIVNAIKGMLRRRFTAHIMKEIFKTVFPCPANSYSSAPIISPIFVISIMATIFHTFPGFVFCAPTSSARLPMFDPSFPRFETKTTTTFASPSGQRRCKNSSLIPAFAQTSPSREPSTTIRSTRKCNQTPKALASQVGNLRSLDNGRIAVPLPAMVMHWAKRALFAWADTTCNRTWFPHGATSIAYLKAGV